MRSRLGEHPGHSNLFRNHSRTHLNSSTLELDLDVDAGGEVELHHRVHGLRGRVDDVQEALMGAHLELFAALLIDVRRTVHRELLDTRRQRNRATDLRTSAPGRVYDLARRRIEDAVIERLEPDPDILAVHLIFFRQTLWPGFGPAMTPLSDLLDDARHHAGADGAAALANGEAKFLLHGDRHDQVHFHRHVVARHHHFGTGRQVHHAGHVGGAEVKLRTVVGEERSMTTALFLGEDVGFRLELGVRLDRAGLAQHL